MSIPTSIASIPPLDLAYAVHRLIGSGKTTAADIVRLAGERVQRIKTLEAELQALTGRGRTRAPTLRATARTAPAQTAAKAAPKPHLSPKLRAFRRVQSLYAGYLRGFKGAARERIRQIHGSEGAASAVEEMRTLLREQALAARASARRAAVKAPAARKASKPASRKLKITPERKAALKIQGTYIGLLRGLPATQQARMKALAAKKGMGAAVEVMRGRG